jgi:bacillithiol system protein YtxJ
MLHAIPFTLEKPDTMDLIADISQAENAIAASARKPAFIYKHSPICGLSDIAIVEFERFRLGDPGRFDFHQVDVIGARPASQWIERLLGVRHESPQALMVWDSRCVWHGSHRAIKEDRLIAEADAFFKAASRRP